MIVCYSRVRDAGDVLFRLSEPYMRAIFQTRDSKQGIIWPTGAIYEGCFIAGEPTGIVETRKYMRG